ncbi:MAG TPA: DUF885 family protein, partial [Blastocatellia bacterium]|nr:DUF885 family protein [Blastocatellia bacterium]
MRRINPRAISLMLVASITLLPCSSAFSLNGQKSLDSGSSRPASNKSAVALNDLDASASEMRASIERYAVDRFALGRFYAVEISPTRQARLKQFYADWLSALAPLNFDSMSQEGKIDYLLFKNHLDHELRQLDLRAKALAEAQTLLPFSQAITDLEDARRRLENIDSPKTAALLTALSKQIEAQRKSVEDSLKLAAKPDAKPEPAKIKKAVANRAALQITSLRNTLKNWFGFYNGYDPVFTWWTGEPYKTVDQSLQNYAMLLREKIVGIKPGDDTAIVGDPIGREALMSELAYEMIPYTPEELIAIGNKEYEWCEAEMKRASRELGFGDDWHKALEHVKTLY